MKPRKPLKRSTKPLKKLGKRGLAKAKAMRELKAKYFPTACRWKITPSFQCAWPADDLHHKKLRSQGGKDMPGNLVPLCRSHHSEAHLDFQKLERIRKSGASLLNGDLI